MVVSAEKKTATQATGDAPPPGGKSKRIDAAGERLVVGSANQWRIAKSVVLLSR